MIFHEINHPAMGVPPFQENVPQKNCDAPSEAAPFDPFPPLCQRFRNPDRPCIWSSAAHGGTTEAGRRFCPVPRHAAVGAAPRGPLFFSSRDSRSNLNKSTEWCFRSWHRDVSLGRSAMSTTALVQSQNDDIRRCCSHVSQRVPPQEHVIHRDSTVFWGDYLRRNEMVSPHFCGEWSEE